MVPLVKIGSYKFVDARHQGLSFPEMGLVFSVLEPKSHSWVGIYNVQDPCKDLYYLY